MSRVLPDIFSIQNLSYDTHDKTSDMINSINSNTYLTASFITCGN